MSENLDIKITTAIDNAGSAKSLGELKSSIRELQSLSLQVGDGAGFKKLNEAIANSKDKIDDLGDSVKTLKGSGVEKLNASFGLFKESINNADFGKAKAAFSGIGAAMKAVPIFLLISGIQAVIENFDKIKKFVPIFGMIETAVKKLVEPLKEFGDWLGITSFKQDELNSKAEQHVRDEHARQIRVAKIVKEANEKKAKEKEEQDRKNEAAYKKHQDELQKIDNARIAEGKRLEAIAIAERDANDAKELKAQEFLNNALNKLQDDEELRLAGSEERKLEIIKNRQIKELELQVLAAGNTDLARQAADASKLALENKFIADVQTLNKIASDKKTAEDLLKSETEKKKLEDDEKEKQQIRLSTERASSQALMDLTSLFFILKQSAGNKDLAAQRKAAEQSFKINKALSLANAVMLGIEGTISTFAQTKGGITIKTIAAVAAAAASAINVAKIAATQFNSSAFNVPATPNVPEQTLTPSATPQLSQGINTPQITQGQNFTPGMMNAEQQPQRVFVLESDITSTQNKVSVIQSRATIG